MANKENIRKWVDALRSGKYKQGQGLLKYGDTFCCLGVACDISGIGKWDDDDDYDDGVDTCGGELPIRVQHWLGLKESIPLVQTEPGQTESFQEYLAILNDDKGFNFKQIADAIELTYLSDEAA